MALVGGNEVSKYEEPSGEGVRVDAALYAGGKPSMHYVRTGMFWGQLRSPTSHGLAYVPGSIHSLCWGWETSHL